MCTYMLYFICYIYTLIYIYIYIHGFYGSRSLPLPLPLYITKILISPYWFVPTWHARYTLTELSLLSYSHLNVTKLTLVCCNILHDYLHNVCK